VQSYSLPVNWYPVDASGCESASTPWRHSLLASAWLAQHRKAVPAILVSEAGLHAVSVNGRSAFNGRMERNLKTLLKWAAQDNDRTMLFGAELKIKVPNR
jgi:hypothetical protein